MRSAQILDKALERLVTSANNGRREKMRLANRLAKMSPEQLRKVSPVVFAALGSNGMQLFAQARSGADSSLGPKAKPAAKPKKSPILYRLLALPWIKGVSVALACILAGVTTERMLGLAIDAGAFQSPQTYQGWPVCRRLDLAGDGCVYWTSSDRLTIEQIMIATSLGPEIIVRANPHVDFRYRLPKGTMLVVPGTLYR